jgi:simple sugar transport system ATP-binding protein
MNQSVLQPRLRMTGVAKRFGPVQALAGADLVVGAGEVHGLLGGNGAGKTTLMNILYGLYSADAGSIEIDGSPVAIHAPRDAISAGVGMVHQTFLQIESYTVTENIVLGTDGLGAIRLDLTDARARILELSERFGLAVDPEAVIEELPVGVRQRVEILKALYRGSRLLVLDEPTTNLTPHEVDDLFASIRTMVAEGMSVILITHKIKETMSVCDTLTVMRGGVHVATVPREETGPEALAAIMVGEEIVDRVEESAQDGNTAAVGLLAATGLLEEAPTDASAPAADSPGVAAVGGVRAESLCILNDHGVELLTGYDLAIAPGEVVGIAGVAGNGQVELAEALAGVRPLKSGHVRVGDTDLAGRRTAGWLDAGVAYVPEDRHRDGILPTRSITENLMLGRQRSRDVRPRGLIDWRRARRDAELLIEKFSVMTSGPQALAGDLSGGNIQRVILGRAFARHPRFLILHNPTRGLDLHSTRFVYEQVRAATEAGCAVLLISEDLDEVLALSDRVEALYSGRRTGVWRRGETDHYEVGRCMTGLDQESAR